MSSVLSVFIKKDTHMQLLNYYLIEYDALRYKPKRISI